MINRFLVLMCIICTMMACKGGNSGDKITSDSSATAKKNEDVLKSVALPETWRWRSDDKSREFTVKILRLTKDSLVAQYCAVYNNGEKMDCDFDQNINIKAAFDKKKNAYVGTFNSFFNSGKGICSIQRSDNSLSWKILKIPAGEYYAPTECILKKQENVVEKAPSPDKKNTGLNSNIYPFDNSNFSEKISLKTTADDQLKQLFNQKYQLNIDAYSELPSNGDYSLYLINNVSGDSDLMYLVTVKGQKLIDGLEIANSNGGEDEETVFSVDKADQVSIYSKTGDRKTLQDIYQLSDNGKFIKRK